jgi:hypothetical protein
MFKDENSRGQKILVNCFLLLRKSDTKTNTNLRNIENFKNETI